VNYLRIALVSLFAIWAVCRPVAAAIYMGEEDVREDSTADGYKDMIILDSFCF
jgi:hypothetical protein